MRNDTHDDAAANAEYHEANRSAGESGPHD
jgi:hypothetical protein